MTIVAEEAQRKGVGNVLIDELLAGTAGQTNVLNWTDEGLALYTRRGFTCQGHVHPHQAVLAQAPPDEVDEVESIRAFESADRAAIHDLDRAASGMDRRALIDALLAIGRTMVVERNGRVSGYG